MMIAELHTKEVNEVPLMNEKKSFIVIVFTVSILLPCSLIAAPNISSVSGQCANGSQITITGTEFGDSGPNIVVFDDFEAGTSGQIIRTGTSSARVGIWTELGPQRPYYTGSVSRSGVLSSQATPLTDTNFSMYAEFPATKEFMVIYWVYLPAGDNWPGQNSIGTNWKQIWVRSDYAGRLSDCGIVGLSSVTETLGLTVAGNYAAGYVGYGAGSQTKGTWTRQMIYWRGSASGSGACFTQYLVANGTNTVRQGINTNGITNMESNDHNYYLVRFNAYGRVESNCRPTMDDCYFASGANCRARVEIGNNANYMSCTNLAISTASSWSRSSITATVRQGSFRAGQTAYVFVVDANGVVSSGHQVVIGSSSSGETQPDAQAPGAPQGVSINIIQ